MEVGCFTTGRSTPATRGVQLPQREAFGMGLAWASAALPQGRTNRLAFPKAQPAALVFCLGHCFQQRTRVQSALFAGQACIRGVKSYAMNFLQGCMTWCR